MKIFAILLTSFILSACGYTLEADSPYRVPSQSLMILNSSLTFPSEQVAIYIQNGKIIPANSIDSYSPFCILELKKRLTDVLQVTPDKFRVVNTKYKYEVGQLYYRQYASIGSGLANADVSHMEYETELYLYSKRQPNVSKMTCKHWIDPLHARYVKIKEIRDTLSPLFTLNLEADPRR